MPSSAAAKAAKIAEAIKNSLLLKRAIDILERMEEPLCNEIKEYFRNQKTPSGTQLIEFDCEYGGYTYSESDRKEIKPEAVQQILGQEAYDACVEQKPKVNKDLLREYVRENKISASKQKALGLKEPKSISLKPNFARIALGMSMIPSDETVMQEAVSLVKPKNRRR